LHFLDKTVAMTFFVIIALSLLLCHKGFEIVFLRNFFWQLKQKCTANTTYVTKLKGPKWQFTIRLKAYLAYFAKLWTTCLEH
jgi:hypothetical protein